MKTTEHMSVSIRKDILKKLKELHKQSNYTSFSEWVDRIVLEPFIKYSKIVNGSVVVTYENQLLKDSEWAHTKNKYKITQIQKTSSY